MTLLIARFLKLKINEKRFFALCVGSFLWYGIPFPQFHFLGVELPEKNILDKVARTSYELSFNSQESQANTPVVLKELPLTEQELQLLKKRKEFWIELAREHPEKIFQTFQHSSLKKATDEYGQDYVFEILTEATKANPELAFTALDQYKSWQNPQGKGIVKPILKIAIEQDPELAFRYLDAYQNLVENNEKIAKSLLQFALQKYKDPLTFDQLFNQVEGRKNKNNLILVFLESASSVDSQKF